MAVLEGLVATILLISGVPFWNRDVSPAVKKMQVDDRCALVSKVLNFKVEIHPGRFQVPYSLEESVKRSASWRGKPLVCASVERESGGTPSPLFSESESCGDRGDFIIFGRQSAAAADLPRLCVDATFRPKGSDGYLFTVMLAGLKEPIGVGLYPVKGVATRKGRGWVLKQAFKPVKASE